MEAIHPGYGFLAENAHFAEICQSCHIQFIGPTVENIRQLGNKSAARELAREVFSEIRLIDGGLVAVKPNPSYAPLFANSL